MEIKQDLKQNNQTNRTIKAFGDIREALPFAEDVEEDAPQINLDRAPSVVGKDARTWTESRPWLEKTLHRASIFSLRASTPRAWKWQ